VLCEKIKIKLNDLNFDTLNTVVPPLSQVLNNSVVVKPDIGATVNYFHTEDAHVLLNKQYVQGLTVTLPNNEVITSTLAGSLPIDGISTTAALTHVYDDLLSASLLSVGHLCNGKCEVTFCKHDMYATKHGVTIVHGNQNLTVGLWDIELNPASHFSCDKNSPAQTTHKLMVTINKGTKASDIIQFYQGFFFSPSKSTFLQAAKNGNFVTWPGLTMPNINKYYTPTMFTA
jgi:hypothetical protein